jgi:glyoxylase-like metal-dependent hydrolase (beta-lactamase superfamily II)
VHVSVPDTRPVVPVAGADADEEADGVGAGLCAAQTPEAGDDIIGDSVRPIFDAGLVDLVGADHRVTDFIWLEPTPGHTPGHVSVRIHSGDADAILSTSTWSPIRIR